MLRLIITTLAVLAFPIVPIASIVILGAVVATLPRSTAQTDYNAREAAAINRKRGVR